MKATQAVVQRVWRANDQFQQVELWVDDSLKDVRPGQRLLVRPATQPDALAWNPYLRDVWWPLALGGKRVAVEVPHNQRVDVGDTLDVLGPAGQPFRFRRSLHNVLLVADDTPPVPLLPTIPALLGNRVSVTLVLLGTARSYSTGHLPPEVEVVRGDDGDDPLAWPDQVTTIGWADQVLAVVHPANEGVRFARLVTLFQQRRASLGKQYLFGVSQVPLPCGVGACEACVFRTDEGDRTVCADGPAFDLAGARF